MKFGSWTTTEVMTMLPENRVPTHPGEVLLEEFLRPLELTQVGFARHIGVPVQRVNELVRGKRGVTSETAWLLAQALGTTPQFWMNLQSAYDLATRRPDQDIVPIARAS
jgi:antitoxin HigA-1